MRTYIQLFARSEYDITMFSNSRRGCSSLFFHFAGTTFSLQLFPLGYSPAPQSDQSLSGDADLYSASCCENNKTNNARDVSYPKHGLVPTNAVNDLEAFRKKRQNSNACIYTTFSCNHNIELATNRKHGNDA